MHLYCMTTKPLITVAFALQEKIKIKSRQGVQMFLFQKLRTLVVKIISVRKH